MPVITRRARAKLNLYLHIEGRRADGYHGLESLVVFTDLADELTFAAATELSLTVGGPFAKAAGAEENNLVMRAAKRLQAAHGVTTGAAITLQKNIPVGAGLGGGSADAAAALQGLNALWQLGLSEADFHAQALALGADVAMCLSARPAIARGIGEQLAPLPMPLPPLYALLVHPRTPLLTADVYAALASLPAARGAPWMMPTAWDAAAFLASLQPTRNHLQPAAITVNPLVAEVLLALETLESRAEFIRMTGSGACCFALYADEATARSAAKTMVEEYPDWWVAVVRDSMIR